MTWKDLPRDPSASTLRQFGLLGLAVFGTLGVLHRHEPMGRLWLLPAVLLGLLGVCRPTLLRPVFVGWLVLVFPIGWLVSRLLLALLYFGLFTPLAVYFRWAGRDALALNRPATTSYWQTRPTTVEPARYFQQF